MYIIDESLVYITKAISNFKLSNYYNLLKYKLQYTTLQPHIHDA